MSETGYRYLEPVPSTSTISRTFCGNPPIGPRVDATNLPRVLIGWNHHEDTPEGLMKGRVFCSVSRYGKPKLQIFNSSGNRSREPGVVVFCGVANFTMIRMFHPYWATAGPNGTIPRDMAWLPRHKDKARLRQLYCEFLRDHYGNGPDGEPVYQVPVEEAPANDNSLFIPQVNQSHASTSKPTSGSSPGRVIKPKAPKSPKKPIHPKVSASKKPRPSLFCNGNHTSTLPNSSAASSSLPIINPLRPSEIRRLTAQDEGESLKSESPGTSVINSSTILSPGHSRTNPIDLIDFTGLQAAVEEQARANHPSSSATSSNAFSQEPGNLADDYAVNNLEDERLLAEWGLGRPLSESPRLSNGGRSTSPSPQLSNGGVQNSIEINEQNAQIPARGSEDTVVAHEDDDDLVIIEEDEDVKMIIDTKNSSAKRIGGLTAKDAIVLC